ncbi:27605_t:CDS:2, partial [Gigaspora margarita]
KFSSPSIDLLCNKKIVRPDPKISDYTTPTSKWTILIPELLTTNNDDIEMSDIDLENTSLREEILLENKNQDKEPLPNK